MAQHKSPMKDRNAKQEQEYKTNALRENRMNEKDIQGMLPVERANS